MKGKADSQTKKNYRLGLKIIAWILIVYLFVNLTLYVMGRVNNITFWGSLIVIAVINAYVVPRLRVKIEQM